MIKVAYLMVYVLGMVWGQIIFKGVAHSIKGSSPIELVFSMLRLPSFYLAISIYGFLTIYWIWLLKKIPLSYAYPYVALSIALVVLMAAFLWGEKIVLVQWIGIVLILLGVICLGFVGVFYE